MLLERSLALMGIQLKETNIWKSPFEDVPIDITIMHVLSKGCMKRKSILAPGSIYSCVRNHPDTATWMYI
jgi:hypothetical protein